MKKIVIILMLVFAMCFIANGQVIKDGDIVTLKSIGKSNNPNSDKSYLSIDPSSGFIKLLPKYVGPKTLWLVKDGGEKGVFRFMNMAYEPVYGVNSAELGYRSTRWLFGNPSDGFVRGNEEPTNTRIKWRITEVPNTSPVQITLENMGQPTSARKWLHAYVNVGDVDLYQLEEGSNGTKWEVEKYDLKGTISRNGDNGVWLLENNCRRLFPSYVVYKDWLNKNGNPPNNEVERIVLETLPTCENIDLTIPPDGTYLRLATGDTGVWKGRPGIWKMEGGKKRLFPDLCTFERMGGATTFKDLDDVSFNKIPDGQNYSPLPCLVPTPSPSNLVCPNGPGIIVTFLATDSNIENYVQATNSVTGKQSEKVYMQNPGGIWGMIEAFQRAAKSVGIVSQVVPNSQSIRVCGRDNLFTLRGTEVSTKQF